MAHGLASRILLPLLAVALLAVVCAEAPLHHAEEKHENEYIVVFKSDLSRASLRHHVRLARALGRSMKKQARKSGMPTTSKIGVFAEFKQTIRGFAARLEKSQLALVRKWDGVDYVVENGVVRASATQSGSALSWNLDRIDQASKTLDKLYVTNSTGCGVNVYVVDSGVNSEIAEFKNAPNKPVLLKNYDARAGTTLDCFNHGTAVASLIGSSTYGVAKRASIFSLRVLNCSGMADAATLISALDFVRVNHVKPAIVTLALGTSYNLAVNTAVQNLIGAGVTVVTGAGNNNVDASTVSPASVAAAITVGATDSRDYRASYSNFGSFVDTFAPGSAVVSWSNTGVAGTFTGTSFASAMVAGVAALYLELSPTASPTVVASTVVQYSLAGVVVSPGSGPNRLVQIIRSNSTQVPANTATATGKCYYAPAACTAARTAWMWGECRCIAPFYGTSCQYSPSATPTPLPLLVRRSLRGLDHS